MNAIFSTILVTGIILVICAVFLRSGRGADSDEPQGEVRQRTEDEFCQPTQQPEPNFQPNENVTPSLTTKRNRSRCAACGAIITATDERCPSCDIAFVTDGSQKWTLGAVGPADGIFLPPREIRE